jgi:hypothetical protein
MAGPAWFFEGLRHIYSPVMVDVWEMAGVCMWIVMFHTLCCILVAFTEDWHTGANNHNMMHKMDCNVAVTIQEPTQVTSCCNLLAPVRQLSFKRSKCKDVFVTSATSVHYRTLPGISFLFARMRSGIHFSVLLSETNRQYLVWWTVSVNRNSSPGYITHSSHEILL